MQYSAKAPTLVETHYKIDEVIDGDSIYIVQEFTKLRKEIRLYGIDAPETTINRKMKEDEQKSQIPASRLLQFGMESKAQLLKLAPLGTRVTILTEKDRQQDFWHRQLGYIILPNGKCLNELMLSTGYAKASEDYYCTMLPEYQAIARQAQIKKKGIYKKVARF